MVATDTSTSTDTIQMVVEHMFDAIENLTDDHVRRHVADPWWDVLNGASPDDLRFRIDAALKSLAMASAELRAEVRHVPSPSRGRVFGDADGWRWDCADCPGVSIAAYRSGDDAEDGLRRHHDAVPHPGVRR